MTVTTNAGLGISREPVSGMGAFLRACRERVQPVQVGIVGTTRRRTPGLRREEVAIRASVSVDWYIRLEQDRAVTPSIEVLDSIAGALNMSAAERNHLHLLASGMHPASTVPRHASSPSMLAILDGLHWPAFLVNHRYEVLACNAECHAVFGADFGTGLSANTVVMLFCDPDCRRMQLDWAQIAREAVGSLRANLARYSGDDLLQGLIADLRRRSVEFDAMWTDHTVEERSHGTKRIQHPDLGLITVNYDALATQDSSGVALWVLTPADGDTHDRLIELFSTS